MNNNEQQMKMIERKREILLEISKLNHVIASMRDEMDELTETCNHTDRNGLPSFLKGVCFYCGKKA